MTRREWLASDDNPDPVSRAAYRALAEGSPPPAAVEPPRPPLAESLRAARLGFRNCRHADPAACSCESLVHCRFLGRNAVLMDCIGCPEIAGPADA